MYVRKKEPPKFIHYISPITVLGWGWRHSPQFSVPHFCYEMWIATSRKLKVRNKSDTAIINVTFRTAIKHFASALEDFVLRPRTYTLCRFCSCAPLFDPLENFLMQYGLHWGLSPRPSRLELVHLNFHVPVLHCESEKNKTLLMLITSWNIDRFSKSFHC